MAPSAETVSFCFAKFVRGQQNMHLQGDALITSSGNIQLTKVTEGQPILHSVGRALYSAPIHIWDKNTNNMANFKTAFSFVISSPNRATAADGLAFFLAPVGTQPPHHPFGGLLGLFPDETHNESNHIVAVEFDTYHNEWDPEGPHIGIDVNSIKSTKFTPWDLADGEEAKVDISYEASSKKLTASLSYPSVSSSRYKVEAVVDLKDVLPEYVSVGFTAATGAIYETHDVRSWSFHSELP